MPVLNYDYKDQLTEQFPSEEETEVYKMIEACSSEDGSCFIISVIFGRLCCGGIRLKRMLPYLKLALKWER